ncbi:MAG: dihydrofolate reductase family protein, partial [Nakamurella sp.]
LFMLMSFDGKIYTGDGDERDFDKDLPTVPGVADGLGQYYALEQDTDLCSFNTGRVMAKVGWNDRKESIARLPVLLIIFDNQPHLTEQGVRNLVQRFQKLYLVTANSEHPAHLVSDDRLEIIRCDSPVRIANVFETLHGKGIKDITLQSGGEMNAALLREGLVDRLSVVVAPILVGGRTTPTLVDGNSLATLDDLRQLRALKLEQVVVLDDSYLHVRYTIMNRQ